jgi:hypothetical protein
MTPTKATFKVLVFAAVTFLVGCGAVLVNRGSKDESLGDGLKNPAKLTAQIIVPADQALIGNFEDGSLHMNPKLFGAKAGLWSATTYGGTINIPVVVPGGANGTMWAIHVSGKLINKGDNTYPSFLLMGKFKPRGFYDASPFHGIRFYYKWPADDQGTTRRFNIPIAATVPSSSGGTCTDGCSNHYGVDLTKTDAWVEKQLAFTDLSRRSGWGSPVTPPEFTEHLKEIVDLEWMDSCDNNTGTYTMDYWVDEVEFF